MQASRSIKRVLLLPLSFFKSAPSVGMKSFGIAPKFENIEYPQRMKPPVVKKVPFTLPNEKVYRTQKKLRLMRGPELYHNALLHKQYGIVAKSGGRLKFSHFQMMRNTLLKTIDFNRAFVIWRVPEPWMPVTQKSAGQRMGSGKGSIEYYCTPVKAEQIILEVGGPFEFFEVKRTLVDVANKLPFRAKAVSQEVIDKVAEQKRVLAEKNLNPWTWKYIIQNNMLGCRKWISKYDRRWFNEYL